MTAAQLVARAKKRDFPAAVILLGPEAYERRRLKEALMASFAEGAVTQFDLTESPLAAVVDDARGLSLFASDRLIWVVNAEAALPRTSKASEGEDPEAESGSAGDAAVLAAYLNDPTPGVLLVFEAIRFDFEGEDKRKQDRVRKFYSALRDVVELRPFAAHEARVEAESLARRAGLAIQSEALDVLVEALGADIARIAVEIEKLALYAGKRTVSADEIADLVPDARATTIFALVNAVGRRDRMRALELLDTLTGEGIYLPLALAFLSTQFRMAMAAREAGLKSASQVQAHFARLGVQLWGSRADQVVQTMNKFGKAQLERAMKLLAEADLGLRDARPDDRIVMEQFLLKLTA
ncbi:MAG TPA: DNA polymerase III subunit delta [Bryobacteraceae bacterium]|nr:DNA polymerase III subunit delta [Bryobacteraceae bacterium]